MSSEYFDLRLPVALTPVERQTLPMPHTVPAKARKVPAKVRG